MKARLTVATSLSLPSRGTPITEGNLPGNVVPSIWGETLLCFYTTGLPDVP